MSLEGTEKYCRRGLQEQLPEQYYGKQGATPAATVRSARIRNPPQPAQLLLNSPLASLEQQNLTAEKPSVSTTALTHNTSQETNLVSTFYLCVRPHTNASYQ